MNAVVCLVDKADLDRVKSNCKPTYFNDQEKYPSIHLWTSAYKSRGANVLQSFLERLIPHQSLFLFWNRCKQSIVSVTFLSIYIVPECFSLSFLSSFLTFLLWHVLVREPLHYGGVSSTAASFGKQSQYACKQSTWASGRPEWYLTEERLEVFFSQSGQVGDVYVVTTLWVIVTWRICSPLMVTKVFNDIPDILSCRGCNILVIIKGHNPHC